MMLNDALFQTNRVQAFDKMLRYNMPRMHVEHLQRQIQDHLKRCLQIKAATFSAEVLLWVQRDIDLYSILLLRVRALLSLSA